MGSFESWVQLLGVVGIGGIATAVITAFANKRLTSASAGAKAVESADTQITNLTEENDRLRAQRDESDTRFNKAMVKLRGWWERADSHAAWDRRQVARNLEHGINDPMPDLYPPPGE